MRGLLDGICGLIVDTEWSLKMLTSLIGAVLVIYTVISKFISLIKDLQNNKEIPWEELKKRVFFLKYTWAMVVLILALLGPLALLLASIWLAFTFINHETLTLSIIQRGCQSGGWGCNCTVYTHNREKNRVNCKTVDLHKPYFCGKKHE